MVSLWKVPTTILTADEVPDVKLFIEQGIWPSTMTQESAEEILDAVKASQKNLSELFMPHAKLIQKTNSGHYIQKDNPQLVIDVIREHIKDAKCKP